VESSRSPSRGAGSSGAGAGADEGVARRGTAGGAGATTEEDGELVQRAIDRTHPRAELLGQAQQIVSRLQIPRPTAHRRGRRGGVELLSAPFDGGGDEIDLDRTLQAMQDPEPLDSSRVIVRQRRRQQRAIVLLVDASGSMRGERMKMAAAVVGAIGAEFAREQLAVIAFWSDAALLLELGARVEAARLISDLLSLPGEGLTNVSFPLELAAPMLARRPGFEQRVILVSDCVHNAGPDPRVAAARLPRVDVLLDVSGEHDLDMGRDLSREGRGRPLPIRDYHGVAAALNAAFAP